MTISSLPTRRTWLRRVAASLGAGALLGARPAAALGAQPLSVQSGQPYVGAISLVAFTFAPEGWAFCDGSTLSIRENTALFALLGTTYGGDGTSTFGLPDLRGRVPLGVGPDFGPAAQGGEEAHALTLTELPPHQHGLVGSAGLGTTNVPGPTTYLADSGAGTPQFAPGPPTVALGSLPGSAVGSGQAHANLQPYQTLNFIIALYGLTPTFQ
jgi:microcystin-dependent protein